MNLEIAKEAAKEHPILAELDTLCSKHDWYYDYSDDHSVWKRGEAEYKAIQDLRKKIFFQHLDIWPEAEEIYHSYVRNC